MEWVVVDKNYLNFLRSKDKHIPKTEYGDNKYKPFLGKLFEVDDFYYVTQISHAQEKHKSMKGNVDFKKIYDPRSNRLIAVINLCYMFPVPKSMYRKLSYGDIDEYRTFTNDIEKSKYIALLKLELKYINKMNLSKSAKKIYDNKFLYPDSLLARRCIDFKFIEDNAKQYISL